MSFSLFGEAMGRLHTYIDRIIHVSAGLSVVFAGMSLDHWVMFIPAIISAIVATLTLIFKKVDIKRRFRVYQEEEAARTRAIIKYLEDSKTSNSAKKVMMATKAEKALCAEEKAKRDET